MPHSQLSLFFAHLRISDWTSKTDKNSVGIRQILTLPPGGMKKNKNIYGIIYHLSFIKHFTHPEAHFRCLILIRFMKHHKRWWRSFHSMSEPVISTSVVSALSHHRHHWQAHYPLNPKPKEWHSNLSLLPWRFLISTFKHLGIHILLSFLGSNSWGMCKLLRQGGNLQTMKKIDMNQFFKVVLIKQKSWLSLFLQK